MAEAGAVTRRRVRCSAWLGVSGADIDRSVTRWWFVGPVESGQKSRGLLPKLNPSGMCVERLFGPNVWVLGAAECSECVVEVLKCHTLLASEFAAVRGNLEPVREIESEFVGDTDERWKEANLF